MLLCLSVKFKDIELLMQVKSGRIGDTQFVNKLKLRIGTREILIFNIGGNGALGTVLGVEEGKNYEITAVIVKFDNPGAGKQARGRNPGFVKKCPDGTIVKKIEQEYSLTRTQGLISEMEIVWEAGKELHSRFKDQQ